MNFDDFTRDFKPLTVVQLSAMSPLQIANELLNFATPDELLQCLHDANQTYEEPIEVIRERSGPRSRSSSGDIGAGPQGGFRRSERSPSPTKRRSETSTFDVSSLEAALPTRSRSPRKSPSPAKRRSGTGAFDVSSLEAALPTRSRSPRKSPSSKIIDNMIRDFQNIKGDKKDRETYIINNRDNLKQKFTELGIKDKKVMASLSTSLMNGKYDEFRIQANSEKKSKFGQILVQNTTQYPWNNPGVSWIYPRLTIQ